MASTYPSTPSELELVKWLDSPTPVAAGTFEIGLVLGGTVSAGCYTAGVLDFMIQALDQWQIAKAAGGADVPTHQLLIKGVTGASGGGVNGAIMAQALAHSFPPVSAGTPKGAPSTGNPLYDIWVDGIDLMALLTTSDLDKGKNSSILNGEIIDTAVEGLRPFAGTPTAIRSYLANPLPVTVTLTNLTGIPYSLSLAPPIGTAPPATQNYLRAQDWVRIAVSYTGLNPNPRPDEFQINYLGAPAADALLDWSAYYEIVKATAAFPIGLPPRIIPRQLAQYSYRAAAVTSPSGATSLVPIVPNWTALLDPETGALTDPHPFLCVDGGATDNEPIELARTALAGLTGRNPRMGNQANRAVFLVDPFAGKTDLGPASPESIPSMALALISGLVGQNRYATEDLMLATDDSTFSRFMISASRITANGSLKTGDNAIASAGLGAFIGFACRDYRVHDYLLGRQNAWNYLKNVFALPDDNPVFASTWTEAAKASFAIFDSSGKRYLPLIPLYGTAIAAPQTNPWPITALNPEDFRDAIESRYAALLKAEVPLGFWGSILRGIAGYATESSVADVVIGAMTANTSKYSD